MRDFKTTREDSSTILGIVARMWQKEWVKAAYHAPIDLMMDLEAVHSTMPLKLDAMCAAEQDSFDLAHDISGICRHLDRNTGQLRDCFVPRFARH